jgi:hypothetical protein
MPNYGKSNIQIGMTASRATGARGGWMGQGEVIASYEGAVPRQAVRDMIAWQPLEVPSANLIPVDDFDLADTVLPDGRPAKTMIVEGVKSIVRSDNYANLGRFKGTAGAGDGYNSNGYTHYLDVTEEFVGDSPVLATGELHGGAQFFIQYGLEENLHDDSTGLEFMPYLMFRSSLDGSLANTWDRGSIIAKCDNMFPAITLAAKLAGTRVKFKRSRFSSERLGSVPAALSLQAKHTVDFVHSTVQVPVLRSQFVKVLDLEVPLPDRDKASKAAYTRAENTREAITALYTHSPMVADWTGTAFGVFQAFDTYYNREKPVRGANKIDRVFERVIKGTAQDEGLSTLTSLSRVLGRELIPA